MRDTKIDTYIADYEWIQEMSEAIGWDECEIVQTIVEFWQDTYGKRWQGFQRGIEERTNK